MYFTKPAIEKKKLMEEGLRRFGLVERADTLQAASMYYGMSASRRGEPMDQLDALLLLSRLKRMGVEADLTIFVAARYAQLNGRTAEELVVAEETKIKTLTAASRGLSLPLKLLRTNDLWYSKGYWSEVERLRNTEGIISSRKGPPFRSVSASFEPELLEMIPRSLQESLGGYDAPSLYRLLEVSEASYLMKFYSVDSKIGPSSEEEYDPFIRRFMGTIQLRQPLDFRSLPSLPKPITPYIGKDGEERIFLSDRKEQLSQKVFALAQRTSGTPMFFDDFLNPFARISILAVEAAATAGSVPVRIGNSLISDGAGMLKALEKGGTANLVRLAPVVAECLWAYLAMPIQKGGASS